MPQRKPSGTKAANVYVALLRGLNVGGKNSLPMKDLISMFTDAECKNVRTYIQSGNVIFAANPAVARRVPALITEAIEDRFGFQIPLMVRTSAELQSVVADNPFTGGDVDPKRLHVVFLAKKPNAKGVAALEPDRSPPDEFVVRGREIYLHCPNGIARTKLTNNYFDSKLATTSTVRGWATVLKLCDLAGQA